MSARSHWGWHLLIGGRRGRRPAPRAPLRPVPEWLDRRDLPAVGNPAVVMLGATTADSKGVTISYNVVRPDPGLSFGVYRSADPTYDAADSLVAASVPALDSAGASATAPGLHTVTIPVEGGLGIVPKRPEVLVVADPTDPGGVDPAQVAGFRTRTIAVITHGGLQNQQYKNVGVPWARKMARTLTAQGYDAVIPFNWVADSNSPGKVVKEAPRLAAQVLHAAAGFPADEPVNVHYIGHSEGAVINSLAVSQVEAKATPHLLAGYQQTTLLDPHAANPQFDGQQYSVGGLFAGIAKLAIDNYQARARDPLATVPPSVDQAEVFFQHTAAADDHGENGGLYNLWGQVPVRGDAAYFNLTRLGATHSGDHGVVNWYETNVVPTLGNGGQAVRADSLAGALDTDSVVGRQATYSGQAQPGSTVLVMSTHPRRGDYTAVAKTVADADGHWSVTTRPLVPGVHRMVAKVRLVRDPTVRGRMGVPIVPLGPLKIQRMTM